MHIYGIRHPVQCVYSVCIHQSFVATCMCNSVFGIYLVTELIIIECAASGCCTFAWICCISSCAYKYKTTRYTNTPLPAPTQLGRRVHPARPIFHGCLNSPCPANHIKLDPATLDFCHWLAIGRKSSVWLAEACNHASSISSLKSGAIEKRWKWPAINTLLYALTATYILGWLCSTCLFIVIGQMVNTNTNTICLTILITCFKLPAASGNRVFAINLTFRDIAIKAQCNQ